ncbi:MAG TPA: biotin/lipoyl-binding protein [Flavobacteriales bacterium]|nr:biotin/lipoyl-binding protein [Flavobacteriales bacterium]
MAIKQHATVNADPRPIELERDTPRGTWRVAGQASPDLVKTGPGSYSVVQDGRSFKALVLKRDSESGAVRVRVGARTYTVLMQDERMRLMKMLGIDRKASAKAHELKAPMPGLVLKVLVKEGAAVKKNDPLLILEAMKMENVIKSTGEGTVKKVHAVEQTAVEKGQLLLSFE